ncbi:membrane protein insertase YidC [Niveispirillum cyanobacteriorum]|uniref:Membrane protein insertase YidC n=1 Tax=Niveispirillum cyanobacteriorum TaxID=1612173 RepID=A0A2K9NAU3_9PROT|nr:membrane protein insertase YidC [Niveispirillum cyanobacteriorum]AUN30248.1 membrane protein insertase YidC [Niveispirillum cyanobacteriorum]GGE56444.1 membrane protein insertase YidC [Niveispirillum cyanobacteriorum]
MTDQKNLVLTIVISIAILFGFHYFYERPRQLAAQAEAQRQQALVAEQAPSTVPGATPGIGADAAVPAVRDRAAVLAETGRVAISTPSLHGSINLRGGRVDDLTLAKYKTTPDKNSPEVVLLAPVGTEHPYYAEFGWVAANAGDGVALPKADTVWTASANTLTPDSPVTLSWDNGAGLVFERTFAIDANYMFTVTQRVRNETGAPVALNPYGFVQRRGTPKVEGTYVLHEGPLAIVDGTLKEYKYGDLKEDGKTINLSSTGGWIGITDKYWLVGLIPDQAQTTDMRVLHQKAATDIYQIDYKAPAVTVAAGAAAETTHRLFAGAKIVGLLNEYNDKLGIDSLDYAVDWGWFYFLTKPFFHGLDWLGVTIGNFGIAILVFTVFLRLAFFPIANKQYEAFAKMKKLQPKMEELKKKHGDNREALSMEMMKLYKEEKANPLAGCLPILLQIPVFFALYKVLYVTIEMRHAPFYGWIHDLSAPDPTTLFNLFGLIPWDPPSFLHIGIWPLLMGVTMWLQQKMNPSNPDPVQQKVFMLLPFIFTYMMAAFPAGLVIYWTWSNLLSIAQQWFIMRRMGVKPT